MVRRSLPRLGRLLRWVFRRDRLSPKGRKGGVSRLRLEVLDDRTLPSVVTWINTAGGDWDTPANWLDDHGVSRLPGPGDNAVIDLPNIIVTHSTLMMTDSVNSLTCSANLVISNLGTLS